MSANVYKEILVKLFKLGSCNKMENTVVWEVTDGWNKLQIVVLHHTYAFPVIIRMIKSKMNACRILVGEPEGK